MGIFNLNWKGKSKAVSSSFTDNRNTISHVPQPQPPPPVTPRWVETPHWNQVQASSSSSASSNSDPKHSECSKKTRESQKPYRKEKVVTETIKCEHKINCRLNIAGCCACLDRRPLTRAYNVYKDGRGLVPEGTRWGIIVLGAKASYWARRQGKGIPDPSSVVKIAVQPNSGPTPSSSSASPNPTPSLKPQQPEHQVEPNEPPPPYSPSASLDGWEILPSYREEEEEYGGRE
ncbi:hypothetical protein BKA65DRAFT_595058 [Rhexocercosporidium sp. MPI-PUGE-AT-0058]|nr:hypothetical protein BKA65DRAFT_595058 [Rhexocercosporidium sp. MPI-PUGE-AT-0058]